MNKVLVLKFGSSILRDERDLSRVVHEIYRHWREGTQVLAVVSALGKTTDQLLSKAKSVCEEPNEWALAAMLATGEATATALLGIALEKAGIPVRVLNPAQAGLLTSGGPLDSELIAVNRAKLESALKRSVVVLPGFVGLDEAGRTTLLGRGGSDLSALFLAHQLSAECVLVKDVDGLYTADPASRTETQRFARCSYETANQVGQVVVQQKAVRFAATQKQSFTVAALGALNGTQVGPLVDSFGTTPRLSPLRIALIGCGTVGGGVYERILALPKLFTITGVAVRNIERERTPQVPAILLTQDPEGLIEQPCDVVVELIGGTDTAARIVNRALKLGRHVITANKALAAEQESDLRRLAKENGVQIQWSAAVGGALPALERMRRAAALGRISSFAGILNATSNFILDRLAQTADLDAAISEAQIAGYAEADPTLDLDGSDAAQKLILLASAAFNASPLFNDIPRHSLFDLDPSRVSRAQEKGQRIRPVAFCKSTPFGFEARVSLEALSPEHPLASVLGAQNRLVIELEDGRTLIVSGKGAGRWPTTESVMADLLEISRQRQNEAVSAEELEECFA